MKVKSVECKSCGDQIYSRCKGDERKCTCGKCNLKILSEGVLELSDPYFNIIDIKVLATPEALEKDYIEQTNKFGYIKR